MGILPPDALNPKKDFGEKPKLFDVYVDPEGETGLLEYEGWEDVLVSVVSTSTHSSNYSGIALCYDHH